MFMIALVIATSASLSVALFRPDVSDVVIWDNRADCEAVVQAQVAQTPPPAHTGLVCIAVPEHIGKQFLPPPKGTET